MKLRPLQRDRSNLDATLQGLLKSATFHVFDVDHTLTRRSTAMRLVQAGVSLGIFPRRMLLSFPYYYLRYRLGHLSLQDLSREIDEIHGIRESDLLAAAELAWDRYVSRELIPEGVRHVRDCMEAGHRVAVASSTFTILLDPLVELLGVELVLGSQMEFKAGRATGWIVGGPCYGEEKARRVAALAARERIDLDNCAFYSDSFRDLPTLELVGRPVAVRPDRVLSKRARRHRWPICWWR